MNHHHIEVQISLFRFLLARSLPEMIEKVFACQAKHSPGVQAASWFKLFSVFGTRMIDKCGR
jgi:hypothetical protein